jgi:hypothetical protein
VLILTLTSGKPGLIGPGLAAFSPFLGVMLPTPQMQTGPPFQWREVVGWVSLWILVDTALATGLLQAILLSFDRCLGRVPEKNAEALAAPHDLPAETRLGCPS